MDVTVNIRGNAQGFRDALDDATNGLPDQQQVGGGGTSTPPPGRSPDTSRQPSLPPSDRLIEEMRREIEAQRTGSVAALSTRGLLDYVAREQRTRLSQDITNRYDTRRDEAQNRLKTEYEKIDQDMEARRQQGIQNLGSRANDPLYRSILDQQIDEERERRYRRVGDQFDTELEEIDKQEEAERQQATAELTDAIRRLTEELESSSGTGASGGSDPNSYINQLREQRRQLLIERDNAPDREAAADAQRRMEEVDKQLRDVQNGGQPRQGFGSRMPGIVMGAMGIGSALGQGDLGGALISGGGMAAMMGANPYVAAGIIAAGAIQKAGTYFSSGYDDLGNLAAYRSTSGGRRGGDAMGFLAENIGSANAYGVYPSDFNLSMDEFYAQASRRIKSRGSSDNWFAETTAGIGMERTLALDQDALVRGAQYDRYGTNVTDALSRLVTVLSGIEGSGVSGGDFTRVQEKFDIQQQLMASYMGRTDKPNYDWANNTLAAFSATGVTQDSRMGNDIASFQNMIQNPMNERMRALTYGVVADLFPETGGRMDLIDRELRNPENEGKIMQAVVQRIQQQFGGTDTTMGYFAFKNLLPDVAPDRLDEYIQQITSGGAGQLLRRGGAVNQDQLNALGDRNKGAFAGEAADLVSSMTKWGTDILNTLQTRGVKVFFGNGATPNSTKSAK